MINVKFPDGKETSFDDGVTVAEALKARGLLKKAVAAKVSGKAVDLSFILASSSALGGGVLTIEPLWLDSKEGLDVCRHSVAHIMAQAVKSLYGNVKFAIGPVIEDGFYYDFDVEKPFTPEDVEKIENRMNEIINADFPFEREDLKKEDAVKLFRAAGEVYKEELLREMDSGTVSIYRQGGFVDLCRGPHLPSTGFVRAFKLMTTAGAYWRGDEKRKMLQRIYGVAFADKKTLEGYLKRLQEAKERDHRKLGKELDLFSMTDDVGAGLVLWHPNGAIVRYVIEEFWKKAHLKYGYDLIYTPHVAKLDMWKRSGHWDFYRENLFSPMDVEGQEYIVKPMNCPFHIQIYNSKLRSYRDLPVRYAELGTVYRFERSGVLHGLLRVRGFTQDDAHIYATPETLESEIKKVLKFTLYILRAFGFNEYEIFLSTRPEKYVGTLDNWASAESALKTALETEGLVYAIDPGEGVFYGPKIDIKIKDIIGRHWQCSTIQVDFNLPERFDITYRNDKGVDARPIMLHRALLGSLERFFGCLIEHYGGAFPVWLSPVQAIVVNVTEKSEAYGRKVFEKLRESGYRAEFDSRNETLGHKIREARLRKIPYIVVVGDKEAADLTLSPRSREKGVLPETTMEDFIKVLESENRPLVEEPVMS